MCLVVLVDISCTLDSTIEDLTAAGENNGEYLQVAKKGGRKGKGKQVVNIYQYGLLAI